MKRLILIFCVSLLFAASTEAQQKSPSPRQGGGSSHPAPKPLPSLGGGTLGPREPYSPKHSTPTFTMTPEMAAQLKTLRTPAPPPPKQPTQTFTITPEVRSILNSLRTTAPQPPKVRSLVTPRTPPAKKQFPGVTTAASQTSRHSNQNFPTLPGLKRQLGTTSAFKPGLLAPGALPWAMPEPLNPTAQAASANTARDKCIELRKQDKSIRCVTKDFAYLRTDPNSFFVNTVHHYDPFRVLAVHHQPTKNGGDSCYYYGDSIGRVQLKHIWIDCRSLDDMAYHPDPPAAVKPQYHQAGRNAPAAVFTTRDYLDKRFSSNLLPETKDGSNGAKIALPRKPKKGTSNAPAGNKNRIEIFAGFDPKKANDPKTHGLYDSLGFVDVKKPGIKLTPRYIEKGGDVVVLNSSHPGKKKGEVAARWVFADRNKVRIVKPPEKKKGKK